MGWGKPKSVRASMVFYSCFLSPILIDNLANERIVAMLVSVGIFS